VLELAERARSQRDALLGWCRDRLRERTAAWEAGNGEPHSILKLLKALRDVVDVNADADASARSATAAMHAKSDIVHETRVEGRSTGFVPRRLHTGRVGNRCR
jgi:hypothetical protein